MPAKFFRPNADLKIILERILESTWSTFPQLAQNQIAITWIPYDPPYQVNTGGALSAETFWQYRPEGASYRGVELIYPAGAIALFYMVALQVWLEQGMIQPSEEMERACRDMVTQPANDLATSYVLDLLTGTTSGPELPPGPFETWKSQRDIINRYFQQLGWPELRAVNMNQKTWDAIATVNGATTLTENRPYGRENEFLGTAFENRNLLTTEATARVLHSIVGGVSVSSTRSQSMMALLETSPRHQTTPQSKHDPLTDAIRAGVPATAKLWSKAGLAARVRHDIAYIEAEGCHPYQLIVFTEGDAARSQGADIITYISQEIFTASQALFNADASPAA